MRNVKENNEQSKVYKKKGPFVLACQLKRAVLERVGKTSCQFSSWRESLFLL